MSDNSLPTTRPAAFPTRQAAATAKKEEAAN
jgi:hypothetical protein